MKKYKLFDFDPITDEKQFIFDFDNSQELKDELDSYFGNYKHTDIVLNFRTVFINKGNNQHLSALEFYAEEHGDYEITAYSRTFRIEA